MEAINFKVKEAESFQYTYIFELKGIACVHRHTLVDL